MTMQSSQLDRPLVRSANRGRASAATAGTTTGEDQLRAWMTSGLDGDAACHAALLRAIRPLLMSFFARRIGTGGADFEDLVQEVLIAVHERRASYDRTRPFTPWLFAVARHKLIDYFRRSRRHQPIEPLEHILTSEGFAPSLEARLDVKALLATLPPKQAAAIRLTRLLEMSVADAAARIGIGQSDVKVSAHRGIRALAARVERASMLKAVPVAATPLATACNLRAGADE